MIADNFPSKANPIDRALVAADELKEVMDSEGIVRHDRWFDTIANLEEWDVIHDVQSNQLFKLDDSWQTFTNFWMDWMWAQKLQRNYVKLALVMQSIARRDGWKTAKEDDFDTWVGLAKRCQNHYFAQVVSLLLILFIALGTLVGTARAAANDAMIIYLGTEVIDTNGIPTINNTYFVDCDGEDLTVTIEITFADGAVALRTSDDYCGAKILLEGAISAVDVVAVAAGPQVVKSVYLPMVAG